MCFQEALPHRLAQLKLQRVPPRTLHHHQARKDASWGLCDRLAWYRGAVRDTVIQSQPNLCLPELAPYRSAQNVSTVILGPTEFARFCNV